MMFIWNNLHHVLSVKKCESQIILNVFWEQQNQSLNIMAKISYHYI
jgi:hypothetical protein